MSHRISFFEQMKNFYDFSFHSEYDFTPHHISLYMFLLNQNNRSNWSPKFKLSLDLGMYGSKIGSKKTYYKTLDDLQNWGLIVLEKGKNAWKSPSISIIPLQKQKNSIPLCQEVEVQNWESSGDTIGESTDASTDLSSGNVVTTLQHPNKDYKTIKQNTNRQKTLSQRKSFTPPTLEEVIEFCKEKCYKYFDCQKYHSLRVMNEWTNNQGRKILNWKADINTAESFKNFQRPKTAEELEKEQWAAMDAFCDELSKQVL